MVLLLTEEVSMSDVTYTENLVLVGIDSTWEIDIAQSLDGREWYVERFEDTEGVVFDRSNAQWGEVIRDFYHHHDLVDKIDDRLRVR